MGTLVFEGRKIHWETHGEGPPLLFLHEWNSSSALFRDHALDRYAACHQVILVDLPGFGRSEALADLSMDGLSRLLVALLDTLGHRRTSVLGFCLGAILGLDFALRHPERVDRLVLVDILIRFRPCSASFLFQGSGPFCWASSPKRDWAPVWLPGSSRTSPGSEVGWPGVSARCASGFRSPTWG